MSNAQPTLGDITFASNRSTQSGGAVYALDSDIEATNLSFSGNRSSIDGGAIALVNSSATLDDAVFVGNTSLQGGAIYSEQSDRT